jgi:hypothetical protein
LEAAILKCVESEATERFQTMEQFLKAIRRLKHEDVDQ